MLCVAGIAGERKQGPRSFAASEGRKGKDTKETNVCSLRQPSTRKKKRGERGSGLQNGKFQKERRAASAVHLPGVAKKKKKGKKA